MRTSLIIAAVMLLPFRAAAEDMGGHNMAKEHGGAVFHKFRLETQVGSNSHGEESSEWELKGWVGTDENKLWLKFDGEHADGKLQGSQLWALYSRNISTFWDAQVGIRHDFKPDARSYLVAGFEGLAPYYLETEAHLFISDEGDLSARIKEEKDFLLTQKLIAEAYLELELFAQDVPDLAVGAGLAGGKIGLQTRYEFTRKFAPYIDVHYARKFGETASIANSSGDDVDEFVGAVGLRLMF